MRLHFVTVPIHGSAEGELNQFLATHRVIAVDRWPTYALQRAS